LLAVIRLAMLRRCNPYYPYRAWTVARRCCAWLYISLPGNHSKFS